MAHEFSEEYLPLKTAHFQGYVNLGGMTFKNIEALRDQCEIHLHRFSGMIMVKRDGMTFFIGSACVQCVEAAELGAPTAPTGDELTQMAASTLNADEILAELGHNAPNLGDSAPVKRQKRSKRSE